MTFLSKKAALLNFFKLSITKFDCTVLKIFFADKQPMASNQLGMRLIKVEDGTKGTRAMRGNTIK
jgi:hypothetical protein